MSRYAPIISPLAREFFFEGGRRGVLLIHGFTGSPGHMRLLGEALRDAGYTVLGICLPGHGATVEEMERTTWNHWLGAARDGYHRLMDRCDDVIAAGLSMGGLLALLLAEEAPLAGVISIASPLRLRDRKARFTPFLKFFIRYRDDSHAPDAPKPHPYSIGYDTTPLRKVPDLLWLMRLTQMQLERIRCPLLVVQPRLDRTVVPESAGILLDGAVNASLRELLWLERSAHVCTLEPEFELLRDNILRFIKNC